MVPSSVPTRNDVGSEVGKDIQVGLRSSVLLGGGETSSTNSCGWLSISTAQPQTTPSVEQEMMLLAFWVPTRDIEYTGCEWPPAEAPVRGVFCTGRGDLERVSHSRTWPLYEPPRMREGWNGENLAVSISEVLWKVYSGRE